MTYRTRQSNTEHPSKTIVKMLRSAEETGVWPRVILLYGKENFLTEWAGQAIKTAVINPATATLDCVSFSENNIDTDEIIAACETLPLMSLKKLIIVEGISETQSPLTDYIPSLPESTLLLIIMDKVNKAGTLYKTVNKTGIVYDFIPLDDATLGGWMAKRLKTQGRAASAADLINFARSCGYGDSDRNYTLFNLENDLKKVFAASDKQILTLDDLMESSSAQAEINAFKILDYAFSGKKGEALTMLHNSVDIKSSSQEIGAVLSFLGLLISQIEIMLEGKEREDDRLGYYDIINEMKVNEYRYKKAMGACRGKSAAQLRRSLDDALQIEKNFKTGAMDAYLALELFIAKL